MIKKFLETIISKKKYWVPPMLFVLIVFGLIVYISQGEIIPFLYTIF